MARASVQDIADLAGVSKMTVSRVLRGEGGSRHQERVLEAARNLDYIPVRTAIQNRQVKTRTVGILEDDAFLFQTVLGSQTLAGVTQTIFAQSYDLLMLHPQHQHSFEQRRVQFLDKRCEGFIFVVPHEKSEILELLVENQIPAVTCYSTDVPDGISWVVPDNETAIRQAMRLLIGQGHKNIAFWSASQGHSDARERTRTFTRCMREAGLPLSRNNYLWDKPEDEMGFEENLPEGKRFASRRELFCEEITAVICHDDGRALGLWDEARSWGLSVPQDLSLIGIDNIVEAQERGLTTFELAFAEVGRTATEALLSLLSGGTVEENCHKIPMPFIERHSVATPRKQPVLATAKKRKKTLPLGHS